MTERSSCYALETTLSDNGGCGEFGVVPLREWLAKIRGSLTESFRGRVLVSASGFLDYTAAVKREGPVIAPASHIRSAPGMN